MIEIEIEPNSARFIYLLQLQVTTEHEVYFEVYYCQPTVAYRPRSRAAQPARELGP